MVQRNVRKVSTRPDNYFYKKLCLQIETCKIIFEALQRDYEKNWKQTQPAITYLKLTIETLEQHVKYVQS